MIDLFYKTDTRVKWLAVYAYSCNFSMSSETVGEAFLLNSFKSFVMQKYLILQQNVMLSGKNLFRKLKNQANKGSKVAL